MDVAGVRGGVYELTVWNPSQAATVEGGELLGSGRTEAPRFACGFRRVMPGEYAHGKIVFHFSGTAETRKGKHEKPAT